MACTEPQGLLAIWANVDSGYQPEFVQWHNCEHVPERVSIPGFHVGHRYRALDDARDFFMVYETDTADVMQSAPYLLLVRSNPPEEPGGTEDVIRWYREEHLPRLGAVDGVLRARLYRADTDISNINTAERQVHGASSGSQAFLAVYELTSPDIPNSEVWREAARGTAWSARMVTALRDLERERYWLDFALWAPGHR